MFEQHQSTVLERFLRYAAIDTQSDPHSDSYPSTEKQKNLGKLLLRELEEIGIKDAEMDEHGLIYATIPGNSDKEVPTICFCSHMDTAPDAPGNNVKPIIHRNYDGTPLVLPDDTSVVVDPAEHPNLGRKIGEDIITASGTTLLGADNKAGLAAIMDATQFLYENLQVKHGPIRILFTCDEEIGLGTAKVDMEKLGAKYGYTVDGEEAGTLENETFSADMAIVTFRGVAAHTGFAKGKMVNAQKVGATFVDMLPKAFLSPETTEGREPFVHPLEFRGQMEEAKVTFLLRSFETDELAGQADLLEQLAAAATAQWPGSSFKIEVKEQYRNMRLILDEHPQVIEYAVEAIRRTGFENPKMRSIRGGTDGSKLTYMGMPCPNIYAGEHAFHSRVEWVSVQDMEKAARTIVHLATIYEENA